MNGVFQLHPSSVLLPLYLFYIVTSEQKPAKRQIGLFFVLFVHFRVSRSKFDGFKRKEQQGDRSEVAQVKEVSAFTFAQRCFLLPNT